MIYTLLLLALVPILTGFIAWAEIRRIRLEAEADGEPDSYEIIEDWVWPRWDDHKTAEEWADQ
jgi:hypothetical protein